MNKMKYNELIRGQIYQVAESYGMVVLKGEYLGKLTKGYNFQCFVFKTIDPLTSSYGYFGAHWRIAKISNEKPALYLYSTHYGDSPSTLKSVSERYQKDVKLDFKLNE